MSPVEGSSRVTVPSRWLATQIEPNAAATAVGPFPTRWVRTTFGPAGSIRATLSGAIETHTPSGVKATPEGRPASGTVSASPELGSTRSRAAPFESAIHRKPSPTAIPFGAEPAGNVWLTSPVSTLIRSTVPSTAFVTQTEPSPTARPAGAFPTGIVVRDRAVVQVEAGHDAAVRLRDPEAPEPDRARAGSLAELLGELHGAFGRVHPRDRVRADVDPATAAGREQRDRDRDEREDQHDPADQRPPPGDSSPAPAAPARRASAERPGPRLRARRGRPRPGRRCP